MIAFFGTPQKERKGRGRFMIISWIILALQSIALGLGIWKHFQDLYQGGPTGFSYIEAFRRFKTPRTIGLIGDVAFTGNLAMADLLMVSGQWNSNVINVKNSYLT